MAKVTAKDANNNDVPVLQVQFNNRGEVESFLTADETGHQHWVHAHLFNVTVSEGEQPVEQPGIMTKDTRLKPNKVLQKTELTPPADDPATPIVDGQDAAPAEPVVPEADTQLPPATPAAQTPTSNVAPRQPKKK